MLQLSDPFNEIFFKLLQKTVRPDPELFSFPEGFSVNDGISNDTFLNNSFDLCLPGVDRLIEFIREKGKGFHIFKTDLRRAFHQIPVDPADIPLLGFQVNDFISFYHLAFVQEY